MTKKTIRRGGSASGGKTATKAVETEKPVGFELKPDEIAVHFEKDNKRITHIFSRLMNRCERLNIGAAASQQRVEGRTFYLIGALDEKFANAYDHMIATTEGYTFKGEPASLDVIKERLPDSSKRRAVEATNEFEVLRPETDEGDGIELDIPEPVVRIEAKQGGEPVVLTHTFSSGLSAAELRKLKSTGLGYKSAGRGLLVEGAKLNGLLEATYDAKIIKAEGYLVEGKNLTPRTGDWLRGIPVDHKTAAINELRRHVESLDRD